MTARLAWLGLWALCGCFDHGDGVTAGTGGAGSGGIGGFGGTSGEFVVGGTFGGFPGEGGAAGFGGTGGFEPPCPFSDPVCTDELRSKVCEDLIVCSTVAGLTLSMSACLDGITAPCVDCMRLLGVEDPDGGVPDDGGGPELAACDPAFEGSECDDFCDLLIQPPQTAFECEVLAKSELAQSATDAQCMCANCFFQVEQCVFDDGCWLIAQCSARTGCIGSDCFTAETCLPVIDAVGATSLGASLVSQLAECSSVSCSPQSL